MDIEVFFSFCLASFLLALMPGPDNIFVLTESITKGARNGVLIALGLNTGVLVHTLAATTGVSLLLKQSETAFIIVQYAGATYLLFLAYKAYQEKVEAFQAEESTVKANVGLIKTGFVMNVLNPKVSLFFIAFLPQFVSIEQGNITRQMVLLGITFMVIGFLTFSSFALLAHPLRKLLSSQRFLTALKWLKITVLLVLAVFLLLP